MSSELASSVAECKGECEHHVAQHAAQLTSTIRSLRQTPFHAVQVSDCPSPTSPCCPSVRMLPVASGEATGNIRTASPSSQHAIPLPPPLPSPLLLHSHLKISFHLCFQHYYACYFHPTTPLSLHSSIPPPVRTSTSLSSSLRLSTPPLLYPFIPPSLPPACAQRSRFFDDFVKSRGSAPHPQLEDEETQEAWRARGLRAHDVRYLANRNARSTR